MYKVIIIYKTIYIHVDSEDFVAGEDTCKSLIKCMLAHPELGGKVAEVFAALGREGINHYHS